MTTGQFLPPMPLDPTAPIQSAEQTLHNAPSSGPSREAIHRAVSTAYYAVFHAVTASNANIQHGVPSNAATAQDWTNTYRQMRHSRATRNLARHLHSLPPNPRSLANRFINLKTARETADYDPNRTLTIGDAQYWIYEARAGLRSLQSMTAAERQTVCNITITGNP